MTKYFKNLFNVTKFTELIYARNLAFTSCDHDSSMLSFCVEDGFASPAWHQMFFPSLIPSKMWRTISKTLPFDFYD